MEGQPGLKLRRPRDLRFDFFRGSACSSSWSRIFHGNSWTEWIPARFGFSDAADLFVFCSGMASALALRRCSYPVGLALVGAARIPYQGLAGLLGAYRQLFVVLALVCAVDAHYGDQRYAEGLCSSPFSRISRPMPRRS